MIEELTDFASCLSNLKPSQRELEGIMALLLMIMHADDKVRLKEVQFLDLIEAGCEWDGQLGFAAYLAQKRGEALAALGDEDKLRNYVARAVDKIDSASLQRPVYLLADHLANADNEVAESEMQVLNLMISMFADAR